MLFDSTLATVTSDARRYGDRVAVICGERQLSFVDLDDRVGRFAGWLGGRGVGDGTVVTLYGAVGWEWVVAYHAVLRLGAVINPVNALLTADEVRFILDDCRAKLIIADSHRLAALQPLDVEGVPLQDIDVLSAKGRPAVVASKRPEDLSTICYTSGTTGRPKGAMLNHRSVLMNAGLTALMHGRTSDDRVVTALPLSHVYGNVVMNSALLVGATLILIPAFSGRRGSGGHRASRRDPLRRRSDDVLLLVGSARALRGEPVDLAALHGRRPDHA